MRRQEEHTTVASIALTVSVFLGVCLPILALFGLFYSQAPERFPPWMSYLARRDVRIGMAILWLVTFAYSRLARYLSE